MMAAIESEFPWLSVKTVCDLQSALVELDASVQLVLADIAFAPALREHWPRLATLHHNANLALIGNGEDMAFDLRALDPGVIQGIVPFDVNLDVFLSVLRIILKGGRYFPASYSVQQQGSPLGKGSGETEVPALPEDPGISPVRTIDKLTKREKEILARIAMGNQNKIIAATLGLSEHTVKIHIHNIITKLGVHNRTEVVALYFAQTRKDTPGYAYEPDYLPTGTKFSHDE